MISGTRAALDTLRAKAPAAGASDPTVLDVDIASHCPLQAATADAVSEALARVDVGVPHRAYLTNTTGRRVRRAPPGRLEPTIGVTLRPIGASLPLGYFAFALGTMMLAGDAVGWFGGEEKLVGSVIAAHVFPLQRVARRPAPRPPPRRRGVGP
ncbi:hypothetical protein ACFWN1_10095 [Streptomyces sp. NPDC058459]|uniref:hypothetical protein n=1 Tax=Streptomyces sp. NPDC058459 TaxID=3346508 RepID=UPI0036644D2A